MFFRKKTSNYKGEVNSRNRINEMKASLAILVAMVEGKDEELVTKFKKFEEEIAYLYPRPESEKADKKISNLLEDILVELNKAIKKDKLENEKLTSLLDELNIAIVKRKNLVKEMDNKEETFS